MLRLDDNVFTFNNLKDYVHTDAIPPKSKMILTGKGHLTLSGKIGEQTTIIKEGSGDLYITSKLDPSIRFDLRGEGIVTFKEIVPAEIKESIQASGFKNVIYDEPQASVQKRQKLNESENHIPYVSANEKKPILPDPFSPKIEQFITNGYSYIRVTRNKVVSIYVGEKAAVSNDGEIIIDGYPVTKEDIRLVTPEEETVKLNQASNLKNVSIPNLPMSQFSTSLIQEKLVTKKRKASELDINVNEYSSIMKEYLESFEGKESNIKLLDKFGVSDSDRLSLIQYLDPLTSKVMDIPVMLNGYIYDLSTLLEILDKKQPDPNHPKHFFNKRDIHPAERISGCLQETMTKILTEQSQRQNQETNLEKSSDGEDEVENGKGKVKDPASPSIYLNLEDDNTTPEDEHPTLFDRLCSSFKL